MADMAYYYLAPVMVFGWWLVCVTYLQHHSENTVVYGNENWKFDLAARLSLLFLRAMVDVHRVEMAGVVWIAHHSCA